MAPKRKPAESASVPLPETSDKKPKVKASTSAEPLVRKKPGRPVGSKNLPPKFKVALSAALRPRPALKAGPQDLHPVKRKVGRPLGSGTKKVDAAALGSADAPKKRGRPVGSTTKPKKRAALGSGDAPRKRGRPVGSKNKT